MKSLVLGKLEQEILSILWASKKPLPVRAVLQKSKAEYAYTTVMTVMGRMVKKGILKRIKNGKSFDYTYTQNKKEYANIHLGSIYDSLVNTYGELAISQFIDSVKEDRNNLKLIEEYLTKNE